MTQAEAVRQYLEEHGSITAMEALRYLGVARLSARIYDLERQGWEIPRESMTCKTRYGKTNVTRYLRPKDRCRAYRICATS
jgi:hypothetical protein